MALTTSVLRCHNTQVSIWRLPSKLASSIFIEQQILNKHEAESSTTCFRFVSVKPEQKHKCLCLCSVFLYLLGGVAMLCDSDWAQQVGKSAISSAFGQQRVSMDALQVRLYMMQVNNVSNASSSSSLTEYQMRRCGSNEFVQLSEIINSNLAHLAISSILSGILSGQQVFGYALCASAAAAATAEAAVATTCTCTFTWLTG